MAAVTHYHKFSGLKQDNLFSYSSGGQKSKISFTGLELKCWQGLYSEGKSVPCLFQGLELHSLLARGPILHPQTLYDSAALCFCHMAFSPMSNLPLFPSYKDTCNCIQVHWDNPG